jgi:cell division protein FtsZ
LYVAGGQNIPVGVLNSITNMTSGILNESNSQVDLTSSSADESKIVMLSSIQGMTKFENYDLCRRIKDCYAIIHSRNDQI